MAFWFLATDLVLLGYLGSQHAEEPYITIGAFASIFYFAWYLVIVPVVGIVENTLSDLELSTSSK
jgi:ubiquinol-cytochrome c reductase cytochrome b subunit